jgi:hypothetical protein
VSIDVQGLSGKMIHAARDAVAQRWPSLRAVAEAELRTLARTVDEVTRMYNEGEIDQTRAQTLIRMQQNALVSVLRTLEGIGIQTARQVSEAAARAAGAIVNRLIGFKLI